MLHFLAACLQPPPGQLGDALNFAQQPQARVSGRMQVGLGWMILAQPGQPSVIWHNGGTWGFRAFAGFTRDSGTAAVVMSSTARSVDRLGLRLAQEVVQPASPLPA